MASRRVTIMISKDLDRKVRIEQARLIVKTGGTVSYSKVINDLLVKGFKK